MKYSLEELAWFNRCLFPDDLQKWLEKSMDYFEAKFITDFYRKNVKIGVLGLYQEYIADKQVTDALDEMVQDFLKSKS